MEASCNIELAICEHCRGRIRDGVSRGCSAKLFAPDGSALACSNARENKINKQSEMTSLISSCKLKEIQSVN